MKLISQPNRWSCMLAATAMLLDLEIPQLVAELGHDGSEIWFPDLPEPQCRRSFHHQEIIDLCFRFGTRLTPFEALPDTEGREIWDQDYCEQRLRRLLEQGAGLIEGMESLDRPHMWAWDGQHVHDPTGPKRSSFDDSGITVVTFWLAS